MQNTSIYLAPYHARSQSATGSPRGGRLAHLSRATARDWPYDNGDDPSFHAMCKFTGQLTWGVCRQDVRNPIGEGDVVVFFSFRKDAETETAEYRLCAVATVEKKVRQTDPWTDKAFSRYAEYSNLLIRPEAGSKCWEHYEPHLARKDWHDDWLWRIADRSRLRKKEFDQLQEGDRFCPGDRVGGKPLVVAENYVIFSAEPRETCILKDPPVVAWHTKGEPAEEWKRDSFSRAIRNLTLDESAQMNGQKRSLRTRNAQRAHRHIVWKMPQADVLRWRQKLLNLVAGR